MMATITGFSIGLFIHVLAVVLAFGPTYGYGIFIGVAQESSPGSVPAVLRGIQKTDRFLVQPGLIVVLLAGLYMLNKADISASESWVSVGFLAIIVLFGMSHAFFRPNTQKALELSERDLAAGDTLSPEFEAVSQKLATGGKLAGLIVVVTIFFMTVQP
jgi:amino acid permease